MSLLGHSATSPASQAMPALLSTRDLDRAFPNGSNVSDSDIKTTGVQPAPTLKGVLLRSEVSNRSTSACFLLLMVGWRPIDAASSLDLATSENRQSAADMKRRNTLRNYVGDRRMIDTAYALQCTFEQCPLYPPKRT